MSSIVTITLISIIDLFISLRACLKYVNIVHYHLRQVSLSHHQIFIGVASNSLFAVYLTWMKLKMIRSVHHLTRLKEILRRFGDLIGSQSQPRSLEEDLAPTADVRDLIGSSGGAKVTTSSSGDDVEVKLEDEAGLLDLRTSQEPRSAYFP